jgi:hypothetical protein
VSWWAGDGNADDIIGGNDGALQGGMGFGAGMVDQAFLLDGVDDYVDAGNDPSLQVSSGDFTVDAWVLFNDLDHPPGGNLNSAPQGDMSIVDKMGSGGNGDGWRLLKQDDNHFWFCFGNGSNGCGGLSSPTTLVSTTLVTTGVWYHVAVVKSAAGFAMYVNGVQELSKPLPTFVDTRAGSLRIGSHVSDGAHLNGMIDEVEIFDRALSGAEIAEIHGAGSAGKCKDNPPPPPPPPSSGNSCAIAEYRFNETGTMAASAGSDATVLLLKDRNGNAADLHGADGSGVSGLSGDRAFDNRGSAWAGFGGRGEQPGDNEALDQFSSFTVQGWLKGDDGPSVTGNLARLVEKTDGFAEGGGWGVDWAAGDPYSGRDVGSIGFGIRGEGGTGGFATAGSYVSQQQWIFFAVTYDGTAASNNVKFYRGTTSQALQLVATGTVAVGTERGSVSPLSVGNGANGARAFSGLLDDIRIFGVKSGNDGVLTMAELETIRADDASNTVTDSDGDGLANVCDSDDDGDGYSDADEIAAGSDPLNANSTPEVCDGADNDLDGQTDEGFPDTDSDGIADCVDIDDDDDGLYDSIDDADLVVSNHFTYNATAGTIVQVPANVRLALYPGGWPSGVMIIMTKVGPVGVNEILRVEIDGKQNAYETRPGPCIDWALLIFGRAECAVQISDPPTQVDVEAVRGAAEMVSLLNGQRLVVGIADGATVKITEITDAAGVLTDVIVEAIGVPGSVTINGNPVPVGTPTAIGKLQATSKISSGKTRSLNVSGTFTPSPSSNGLNPLTEQVAFTAGPYQWTIAAGSFKKAKDGAYLYDGTIGGVQLSVQMRQGKGGVWTFQVNANGIGAITTPTAIGLVVGNDAGATTG